MRNTALFIVATLLLLAGAWWQYQLVQNLTTPLPTETSPDSPQSEQSTSPQSEIELEIQQHESAQQEIRDIIGLTAEHPSRYTVWKLSSPENTNASIQINPAQVRTLNIGDTLNLPLPDGNEYQVSISSRKLSTTGTLHLKGSYEAYGISHPVIITHGDDQTFGTISSPEGIFELSASGETGKLVATSQMDEKMGPLKSDMMADPVHSN